MDMDKTLEAVVAASNLPLSLLIVGVGNEDFRAMEALDGDKKRIKAPNGQKAVRDCVQFCELRPNQVRLEPAALLSNERWASSCSCTALPLPP